MEKTKLEQKAMTSAEKAFEKAVPKIRRWFGSCSICKVSAEKEIVYLYITTYRKFIGIRKGHSSI
jgi:hypothetical protein